MYKNLLLALSVLHKKQLLLHYQVQHTQLPFQLDLLLLKSFYQIRDIIIDVDINSLDISHMGHGKSKKIIKKVDIKSN